MSSDVTRIPDIRPDYAPGGTFEPRFLLLVLTPPATETTESTHAAITRWGARIPPYIAIRHVTGDTHDKESCLTALTSTLAEEDPNLSCPIGIATFRETFPALLDNLQEFRSGIPEFRERLVHLIGVDPPSSLMVQKQSIAEGAMASCRDQGVKLSLLVDGAEGHVWEVCH